LSAILKALRKIENQSSEQGPDLSLTKKLDTKRAMNQRVRKTWLLHRAAILVGFILVLTTGVVIGLTYMSFSPKGAVSSPAVSETPKNKEALVLPRNSEKPGQEKQRPAVRKNRISEGRRAVEGDPAALSLSKVPAPVPEERVKQRTAQRRADPSLSRSESTSLESDEPVLELQAVVWSEEAESRFAVINGNIVRAGGKVEGVTVTDIGRTSVSLKFHGRSWTMKMMGAD
jgi:Type II secretion system protein B